MWPKLATMNFINNNIEEMDPQSSRYLVVDYINYRIEKQGHVWERCPHLERPNKIHLSMRTLGDEFEERYRQQFDDMVNQLHVTPDTAYPTFRDVVNELFRDGVNWGRIVALFVFGGSLAIQSIEREMPQLVDCIVDWVATYISHNLDQWISSQGGWNGFVEFYEKGPERRNDNPWPSFGKICGYAAGAIGVLTLGAFLAQKS